MGILQYLGMQDIARKKRLDNGPLVGVFYSIGEEVIPKYVINTKCKKGRGTVFAIVSELEQDQDFLLVQKFRVGYRVSRFFI